MRNLLFLLLLALPISIFAKGDLDGHWREVKRLDVGGNVVDYTDTIHMQFLTGNEYVWHKTGSFIYRGTYKIENGNLDIGRRYFKIEGVSKKKLVLKDDLGTYYLEPYTPQKQANSTAKKQPETYDPVHSIDQMAGKWSVYKRTSDRTLQQVDYVTLLKSVTIFERPEGNKHGYFYGSRDGEDNPSWYVTGYNNQTIICEGDSHRKFKVIKCQDNEMILEEDGITYFFKQFKDK